MKKLKQIKKIMCPVCGKFYFDGSNDKSVNLDSQVEIEDYEEELNEYKNGKMICHSCGWIYDINQAKVENLTEGFNKKSVNELKKEYEKKIKINPNYFFYDELYPNVPVPHKCPICGEYEFADGSFL